MHETARWMAPPTSKRRIVMWGAGDQGRVNAPLLRELGLELAALVDDTPGLASPLSGVPLFRGAQGLEQFLAASPGEVFGFVIAIGNPHAPVRLRLHDLLVQRGLDPVSFVDPSARLCASARYGEGLQVMPMAIVNNDAFIGKQCILNTRSLVEHDCHLMDGVEMAPGAVLCGRVTVGEHTWIGANATVNPRLRIGAGSIVGSGSVVTSDVPDHVVVAGVPARVIREVQRNEA